MDMYRWTDREIPIYPQFLSFVRGTYIKFYGDGKKLVGKDIQFFSNCLISCTKHCKGTYPAAGGIVNLLLPPTFIPKIQYTNKYYHIRIYLSHNKKNFYILLLFISLKILRTQFILLHVHPQVLYSNCVSFINVGSSIKKALQ